MNCGFICVEASSAKCCVLSGKRQFVVIIAHGQRLYHNYVRLRLLFCPPSFIKCSVISCVESVRFSISYWDIVPVEIYRPAQFTNSTRRICEISTIMNTSVITEKILTCRQSSWRQ